MRARPPSAEGRRAPGARRTRVVVLLTAAFVALGVGAAFAARPEAKILDDLDGRTWIVVDREAGPTALLLNGVSGLIEAESPADEATGNLAFASSDGRRTLLAASQSVTVIDDATHTAVTSRIDAASAALLGERVLVLDQDAGTIPVSLGGEVLSLPGAPAPARDARAFRDRSGDVWYLGSQGGSPVAVSVEATTLDVETHAVAPGTNALQLVDGSVFAAGPDEMQEIDGKSTLPFARDALGPAVAVAPGDVWAFAEGDTVTAVDGAERGTHRFDGGVEQLSVWYGQVAVLSKDGLHVGQRGRFDHIDGLGSDARFHLDGGLLWAIGTETAIALMPDGSHSVIKVANADLSLCVADCSAAAASTFLERRASTAQSKQEQVEQRRNASTPEPRSLPQPRPRLQAPAVTPTLPSTTVPPRPRVTTSTVQEERGEADDEDEQDEKRAEVNEAPTSTTLPAVLPPDLPANDKREDQGRDDKDDKDDESEDTPPPPPPPSPTPPPPVVDLPLPGGGGEDDDNRENNGNGRNTTTTTAPPPATTTTTAPTTTTTTAEENEVAIAFEVEATSTGGVARVQVHGTPDACGAKATITTASLTWTGGGFGREMVITWDSRKASESDVTEAEFAADPGEVTVTVTVCGVSASRTTTVSGDTGETTTTEGDTPTTTTPDPTTTTPDPTTTTTTPNDTTTTTQPDDTTTTTSPPVTTVPDGSGGGT